jgi:hypothetical protein
MSGYQDLGGLKGEIGRRKTKVLIYVPRLVHAVGTGPFGNSLSLYRPNGRK